MDWILRGVFLVAKVNNMVGLMLISLRRPMCAHVRMYACVPLFVYLSDIGNGISLKIS